MTRTRVIETLTRRLNYCRAQLATMPESWGGRAFVAAEVSALEYALGVMEDASAIGLEELGRLTLEDRQRLKRLLEGEERAA